MPLKNRTILIVEDDLDLNNGVNFYFSAQGFKCIQAFSGEEALNIFENNIVELIVLDQMLPKLSGKDFLKAVRSHSSVPVIMLTALSEEKDKLTAFSLGCDDYLTKPFSLKELEARVTALLSRTYAPDDIVLSNAELGMFSVKNELHEIYLNGELLTLKRKEYDLLYFLICNPGRVFSREDLIQKVWGDADIQDYRTVDSHIKLLRRILGEFADCIQTVWGIGYKFSIRD